MTTNHARLLAILSAIVAAAALRLVPASAQLHADRGDGAVRRRLSRPSRRWLSSRRWPRCFSATRHRLPPRTCGRPISAWSLIVLLGWAVLARITFVRVGAAAVASSVLFFLLTNFSVWLGSSVYPQTFAGLAACYVAAIPFFQNTSGRRPVLQRPAVRRFRAARAAGSGAASAAPGPSRLRLQLLAAPCRARAQPCGSWSETSR